MLESFLVAGRQNLVEGDPSSLVFGQSITDACIGWEDTSTVFQWLGDAVAERRRPAKT